MVTTDSDQKRNAKKNLNEMQQKEWEEEEEEGGGTFAVGVSWPYRRPRLPENILKLYIWVPFLCAKGSEEVGS